METGRGTIIFQSLHVRSADVWIGNGGMCWIGIQEQFKNWKTNHLSRSHKLYIKVTSRISSWEQQ